MTGGKSNLPVPVARVFLAVDFSGIVLDAIHPPPQLKPMKKNVMAGDLFISRRPCDQPGDWTYNTFFGRLLDEVAIYNRALSTEEIQAICLEENHGEALRPSAAS